MFKALTYDDVLLVPQYSDIRSRKEVNISATMKNISFSSPIISSPMSTVTDAEMAMAMFESGGLGIIHRYYSIDRQVEEFEKVSSLHCGCAIGVTGDYIERAHRLFQAGCRIFCIDVAHGHSIMMKEAIILLRESWGHQVCIIAGNVATLDGFNDLADWGADAVRCNIGGGSICSTRIQTGHGVPGLQTIMDCASSDRDALIIADGGIRNSGDIVKALAAGADLVMLGSLLAGTEEAPGEAVKVGGEIRKVYSGMASKEAQLQWKGSYRSVEGISSTVKYKGTVGNVMKELCFGIESGLSYSGARSIKELQDKARFVQQTPSSVVESGTHIQNSD